MDVTSGPDYAAIFREYIVQGLQAMLARCQATTDLAWFDQERNQALHLLNYGLQWPPAWPLAHQLLVILTPYVEKAGVRDPWIAYLEQGIDQSLVLHDEATAAELNLQLGALYQLSSQYLAARRVLTASINYWASVNATRNHARALNRLAYVARLQRQLAEADALVNRAIPLLSPTDIERAFSYFIYGALALDRQDWQTAGEQFQASLTLWQNQGDVRMIAQRTLNLGVAFYQQQQYEQATACFTTAINLFTTIGDPVQQAVTRMNLGNVKVSQGQRAEALVCYALAEPELRAAHDQLHLAMLYNNVGIVHRDLGQWQEAMVAFAASVALWRTLDNLASLADTLNEWGLVYLQQTQWQPAHALFSEAWHCLAQIQPDPGSALLRQAVQENLAKIAALAIA